MNSQSCVQTEMRVWCLFNAEIDSPAFQNPASLSLHLAVLLRSPQTTRSGEGLGSDHRLACEGLERIGQ